jgi:hypothetical protein
MMSSVQIFCFQFFLLFNLRAGPMASPAGTARMFFAQGISGVTAFPLPLTASCAPLP